MRYKTCGDWWFDDENNLEIRVADLNNWKYEYLIARHEQDEAILCYARGISEKSVSDFDISFEEMRDKYPEIIKDIEPGDFPSAPYRNEHGFATGSEKMMAGQLEVDWVEYEKTINALNYEK